MIFLYLILAVLALILIYAALKTPQQRIEREAVMRASPDRLFPYLNNSQKMNEWMPWKAEDPQLVMMYSGPVEGVGSKSFWDSPGRMGKGEALITESTVNRSVKTTLTYSRPMQMVQHAEMHLTEVSSTETKVRWSVDGHNNFIFRLVGIFMNMDKMIGGSFERGLANLKAIVEAK